MPDSQVDPNQTPQNGAQSLVNSDAWSNPSAPATATGPSPTAAPVAPAAPRVVAVDPGTPGASATSKNTGLHTFVSSILSAMVGKPPQTYSVNSSGKLVGTPVPETTGDKVRRLANTFGTGLAAGSQVEPRKSGLANALAGFGAGFGAESAKENTQDAQEREQAVQDTLRQRTIALSNAQNLKLFQENLLRQNDMDPVRAQNKDIAEAFKNIPGHSVTLMDADAARAAVNDPNNSVFAHTHLILPAGMVQLTDDNGNPVKDTAGNFKSKGQVYVIDGMKDGKVPLPASMVSEIQRLKGLGDLAPIGSSLDGLQPDQEVEAREFLHLYSALGSARVVEAKGWASPDLSEDKDGNVLAHNTATQDVRPASYAETQKFQMDKANLAEKQQQKKTSAATEAKEDVDTQLKQKQLADEKSLNPPASAGLTGENYLKTLPTAQQQVLRAIAEGRETRSPRQLQDKNGNPTPLAEALHRAYPDFDDKKAAAYGAVVKDFTSGPTSRALTAYGTAINHARALYDNTDVKSYIPGTDEYKRYNQDITYVATEVAKALNPTGVATENAIKEQEDALRSYTNRKAAVENAEHILTGKMAETKQRWANAQVRPSYQPPMPGLSQEAIDNADYIRNHGRTQNPQSGQKQNPFRGTGQ